MSGESQSFEAFIAALQRAAGAKRAAPPVHLWNPAYCGEAGFEILKDGTWKHEGVRITRAPMVRLFASILRKDEDGCTYLVTPAEKIRVEVEDAPFLAVRADRSADGKAIAFTTNVGDVVTAGPDNPIRVETDADGAPRPYVLVRGRLEARILRAPFYELVGWAEENGGVLSVESLGARFALGRADGL